MRLGGAKEILLGCVFFFLFRGCPFWDEREAELHFWGLARLVLGFRCKSQGLRSRDLSRLGLLEPEKSPGDPVRGSI